MASSKTKSTTTSNSYQSSSHESHESHSSSGGLFSTSNLSSLTSPEHFLEQSGQRGSDLEKAQAALREREAQLDEREAALRKQQDDLAKREDALDAAHERLIGGGGEEDEDEDQADKSSAIIDELRKENEKLRTELATSKQKSSRFLSQRAQDEEASGRDRFRLSERKTTPGGGLPMGFDPQMLERWRAGHQMMTPRKPRTAESRPDGK